MQLAHPVTAVGGHLVLVRAQVRVVGIDVVFNALAPTRLEQQLALAHQQLQATDIDYYGPKFAIVPSLGNKYLIARRQFKQKD